MTVEDAYAGTATLTAWNPPGLAGIRRSYEQANLSAALAAFQAEMGVVAKESYNPFFKSKYADISDVFQAALPLTSKHGLSVTQHPTGTRSDPTLTTVLKHVSGEWEESDTPIFLSKNDSQQHGAAITYMRRFSFCSILGIVSDVDDDGNSSSTGAVVAPATTKATPATKPGKTTFADAAKAKKDTAPVTATGIEEAKLLATTKAEIWNLAATLAPSKAAAAVRTFIKQQGKYAFGDGFSSHDDLTEGEAQVFLSNLKVMTNQGASTNTKLPDSTPGPNPGDPSTFPDEEEF